MVIVLSVTAQRVAGRRGSVPHRPDQDPELGAYGALAMAMVIVLA
jgi:hypothetical protein